MTVDADFLRERVESGASVDLRGDGKAGGGLVLAMQSFGAALASRADLDVQDWPLFSSARKGANVRAYLRVAKGQVQMACQVTSPTVALLMNEAAGEEIDFADGTRAGLYIVNTTASPEQTARRYRLGGTVVTIAADALGQKYLGRPLGNVGVFAALAQATGLVPPEAALGSLLGLLKKRRIPARLVDANAELFRAALEATRTADVPATEGTDHRRPTVAQTTELPVGAQSALRTSRQNHTSGYGRPGVRVEFDDARQRCNACSLCVGACPEGIIAFTADPRGALVTGANFDDFCKVCRECIAACPLDLFREVEAPMRREGVLESA